MSGTPDLNVNIGGFAIAHTTTTPLTIGDTGTTTPNFASSSAGTGVAAVFTLDSGCTETCNIVTESLKVTHGRVRGAVPIAITGKNASEVTEAWATS